jgi:hypothetical protein
VERSAVNARAYNGAPASGHEAPRGAAGERIERRVERRLGWKWRRNTLKRLNPGLEMVWASTPRTYYIWYTGAWLTGGSSGATTLQKKAPIALESLDAEMKSHGPPTTGVGDRSELRQPVDRQRPVFPDVVEVPRHQPRPREVLAGGV